MTIEVEQDDPVTPTEARKDARNGAVVGLLNFYLGNERLEIEMPAGPLTKLAITFRTGASKEAIDRAISILELHKIDLPDTAVHTPTGIVEDLKSALAADRAMRGIVPNEQPK